MPLRATLNGHDVYSFEFTPIQWQELKHSYKNQTTLTMPCCGHQAVPKNSKLQTQFFTHAPGADCASPAEGKEHLEIKMLIAQTAKRAGWHVVTEYRASDPDGDNWVADVYCERGSARIAFEVQWSQQTQEEFIRRTDRYTRSGVRACWFFRITKKEVNSVHLIESKELPYFGFRNVDSEWVISRYNVPIADFVSAMLAGHLTWYPTIGKVMNGRLGFFKTMCWRCRNPIHVLTRLEFDYGNGVFDGSFFNFFNDNVPEWIEANIPADFLNKNGIGAIKYRVNEICNGCIHCDLPYDNHDSYAFATEIFYVPFKWRYRESCNLVFNEGWYYRGEQGEFSY
ncbi:competence protein CoiA [Vibrio cincinnatiensis]|uniref:competence protein CoiA n=1 Tax=Vibrio cincinnatiensis TaxID=675 RepID=UPI001EE12433|nr:competence protein CoiA family protein [Vibrio cincinnatiensis]MCG3760896.1 hypothetical protein [Vibrio cincinnatiensis]